MEVLSGVYRGTKHLTLRIDTEEERAARARDLPRRLDPEGSVEVERNPARLRVRARILPHAEDDVEVARNTRVLLHDLVDAVVTQLGVRVRSVELDR